MNLRRTAVILSLLLAFILPGCAVQQPSPADKAAFSKLRDQCQAGDNQACENIAEAACLNGTPTTCKEECWPTNVARACAQYPPGRQPQSLPGGSFLPGPM
jgi:hypothetical protein